MVAVGGEESLKRYKNLRNSAALEVKRGAGARGTIK